jgi:hypothetical protein
MATMSKRGVLKERKFILTEDDCFPKITGERETNELSLGVYNALKRRKWKTICSLEGLAYEELVAEFYSNLKINDNDPIEKYTSYVRGKEISFHPHVINEMLNTPMAPNTTCELGKLMHWMLDMEEINKVLCNGQGEWTMDAKNELAFHMDMKFFTP